MVDLADVTSTQKKRRSQHPHGSPRNPSRILMIAMLRAEGKTWREIGPRIGVSAMGAYLLHRKWKEWLEEQKP